MKYSLIVALVIGQGIYIILLGLTCTHLTTNQVRLACEIGRLEKQVELINDSNKMIGYRVLPQSSFDNMTPEGYKQLLTNHFTIKFTDCKN